MRDINRCGGTMELRPLHELLDDAATRFPERIALDFLDRRWSYASLADLVARATKGFQRLGVKKGVQVGLCLPNTPYFVICYYAVLKAGGTVVNYNPLYAERELLHQIQDSGTSLMVTIDVAEVYSKVARMLNLTPLERVVVCPMADILPPIKGLLFSVLKRAETADVPDDLHHLTFERLIANDGEFRPVDINPSRDIAVLQYTGGTTGTPKGAMLTHANLFANTKQVQSWMGGMAPEGERLLAILPLFHVFAMTVAMNLGLAIGAELILLPRFDLRQVLKAIARKQPTLLPGVPTLYGALNEAASHGDATALSSIRRCISGGAPLPAEIQIRFETLTGCSLVEGYGLSEASPVVTCNPLQGGRKAGAVGLPLPGTQVEIRSLSDPTLRLGAGEKGEICVRGPQVMAGYWNNPEETQAAFVDGALRTGDVGIIDEDGYLFLVDRIKDIIFSSGYNVYPRIIEEALYRHPAVAEALVIGVPDAYRGEVPKAFVRLRAESRATPEELQAFLAEWVSRIEMPRWIEVRETLPKTSVGKLSRKALMAEESDGVKGP